MASLNKLGNDVPRAAATIVFLLAAALNISAAQHPDDRALLDKYCVACHNEKLKTAGLLLDKADLDRIPANDRGETAMQGAAFRAANDIIRYLASQGAKVNVKNKQNLMPLDVASGKNGRTGFVPNESTVALLQKLTDEAKVAEK